jgi:hypothetical protein
LASATIVHSFGAMSQTPERELHLDDRRRVWSAMSELFLDTEIRWFIPDVARVLADSPFSWDEIDRIWRHEAMPTFRSNLQVVAGEWAALTYDEAALIACAQRDVSWLRAWWARLPGMLEPVWRATRALAERLRAEALLDREKYTVLWRCCASAFVEESVDDVLSFESTAERIRESGMSPLACTKSITLDFIPAYGPLLQTSDRRVRMRRNANVFVLLQRAFPDVIHPAGS